MQLCICQGDTFGEIKYIYIYIYQSYSWLLIRSASFNPQWVVDSRLFHSQNPTNRWWKTAVIQHPISWTHHLGREQNWKIEDVLLNINIMNPRFKIEMTFMLCSPCFCMEQIRLFSLHPYESNLWTLGNRAVLVLCWKRIYHPLPLMQLP